MKQEASFSLGVGLILPWSERRDPFCLSPRQAESDLECWQLPPTSALVELFGQVHTGTAVPSPHFPLPLAPNLRVSQFRELSW